MFEEKVCKCCGKSFIPSKNDKRIVYCSEECRILMRDKTNYNKRYYQNNKDKWQAVRQTEAYKERRKKYNETRREKYRSNEAYREDMKERARQYGKDHPEKRLAGHLKKLGITVEQYKYLNEKQSGKCAICGSEIGDVMGNRLYVDHNHQIGKVRGLLCSDCNFGIGKFHDRIDLLQNAIKYLEETDGADSVMVRP